ncbi:hydroxyisourate hydrolase [Paenibacillus solisilvae]|uniref:5-hydroxyisourate hydrolase n=1 Tax=Paenibacillus solisilvae TaxID=2486751 RepID=A0ABW0VWF6_9BACL
MSGRITTHVLDLSQGKPAAGMHVQLWLLPENNELHRLVKAVVTNEDGRLDSPLLEKEELQPGLYQLVFSVADYFRERGSMLVHESQLFLDEVPVRFRVTDSNAHYHVPLLVAPGGYSTYRGS